MFFAILLLRLTARRPHSNHASQPKVRWIQIGELHGRTSLKINIATLILLLILLHSRIHITRCRILRKHNIVPEVR